MSIFSETSDVVKHFMTRVRFKLWCFVAVIFQGLSFHCWVYFMFYSYWYAFFHNCHFYQNFHVRQQRYCVLALLLLYIPKVRNCLQVISSNVKVVKLMYYKTGFKVLFLKLIQISSNVGQVL